MKLAKFNHSYYFIPENGTFITPNGEPDEVIDITGLSGEEILKLKNNPNDKKLVDKIKRNNLPH
jgi:hypothetical protein